MATPSPAAASRAASLPLSPIAITSCRVSPRRPARKATAASLPAPGAVSSIAPPPQSMARAAPSTSAKKASRAGPGTSSALILRMSRQARPAAGPSSGRPRRASTPLWKGVTSGELSSIRRPAGATWYQLSPSMYSTGKPPRRAACSTRARLSAPKARRQRRAPVRGSITSAPSSNTSHCIQAGTGSRAAGRHPAGRPVAAATMQPRSAAAAAASARPGAKASGSLPRAVPSRSRANSL